MSGGGLKLVLGMIALTVVLTAGGCSGCDDHKTRPAGAAGSSGAPGGEGGRDGGSSLDGGDAEADAAVSVVADEMALPPGSDCARHGDSCRATGGCCSGVCDHNTDTCVSSIERCAAQGASCKLSTDCCNLSCLSDGRCGMTACVSDGKACGADGECCGQRCSAGTCEALNTRCKTAGNDCAQSGECCSGLCKDLKCQLAASFCVQRGDLCGRAEDCCSGRCAIPDGRSTGVCDAPPSGASFCTDGVEGSLCGDCNECCSRLCAPYAATGVRVCQPASGCHVTGDFCRSDKDCCGAGGTGLPGEGNVYCEKDGNSDLGVCRNPMSCNPQGNVCHYKDYACGVSSARANCCAGLGAKGGVCQLDPLGVPRCNGLGDSCREQGETCASADDCCDDRPCVPDQAGVLRCAATPEGQGCLASDSACTVNADCCAGETCIRPIGSTQGSCRQNSVPDAGTRDAGASDAGSPPSTSCAQYGQNCASGADCCNGVPCNEGICRSLLQ